MSEFLHHPVTQSAITGLITAAYVDVAAFRKWTSWEDAIHYSWGLASWRWFQGAALGALAGLGFAATA